MEITIDDLERIIENVYNSMVKLNPLVERKFVEETIKTFIKELYCEINTYGLSNEQIKLVKEFNSLCESDKEKFTYEEYSKKL